MTPHQFNTITGSDWRVSLIAARSRRTLNQIKFRKQISEAMKTTPRVQSSSRKKIGPKMLAAHADKKEYALNLLHNGYSSGAISRNLEVSPNLIVHWRDEAGIPPCKPGCGRPTPAVGEVLSALPNAKIRHSIKTTELKPLENVTPAPFGSGDLFGSVALFVPLKREYFEAFERGEKEFEYREYGPRWNELTCREGRAVTLSMGYGKARRLRAVITHFSTCATPSLLPGWNSCYGDSHRTAAIIGIKVLANA